MPEGLRSIHLAQVGTTTRPVLLLAREVAPGYLTRVSVAPVASTVRGTAAEVPVGRDDGLHHDGVVNLDQVRTVPSNALGRPVGFLLPQQEVVLTSAVHAAHDLA